MTPTVISDPAIEVKGLSKEYRVTGALPSMLPWRAQRSRGRRVQALDRIDLDVAPGSVLGVIGPNGSGKSTLLKVLARVSPPTAGRVVVRGRVVSMLELGAAFQPDATGRENVYLNAALNGIPRSVVRHRMDDIVEFAELERFIDTPVAKYSSGMYLRLAFSVAVNMEPDVLLADEVLAVGDIAFQERCFERIEADGERGLTVLFVSHDLASVRRLCSRVIWLDGGRIRADGEAEDVTTAYETVALGAAPAPQQETVSPVGAIVDTAMLDAGASVVTQLGTDEEAYLQAIVRVDDAPLTAWPAAVIYAHGMVAFRTGLSEPMTFDSPGHYRLRVRIPANLLAETTYTVKFGVRFCRGEQSWPITRNRAAVVVVEDRTPGAKRHEPGQQGFVKPRLEWSAEPLALAEPI